MIVICIVNSILSNKFLNSTIQIEVLQNNTKGGIEEFNLSELNKIKYIIEFSRKNDFLNKIYENKGNITLNDIFENHNHPIEMKEKDNTSNLITSLNSNIIYLSKKISNQDKTI
jgi:hypothetical protein